MQMFLNTRHFGKLDIEESGIIRFEGGIPGFPGCIRFVLLGSEDRESPFRWLQSVDDGNLAFALINPFFVKKDYDIEIEDSILEALRIESPGELLVFAIVVIPEDTSRTSMNLRAPVIISKKSKKGAQIVLDTDRYGVRHYIVDELRKQEVAGNAGADKKERAVYCNK